MPLIQLPTIFDTMEFVGKPDLGASSEMGFIHEWEATLRDEEGVNPSSYTIEEAAYIGVALSKDKFKYVVIDIEAFLEYHDPIAQLYVQTAQATIPKSNISWWNVGPANADRPTYTDSRHSWSAGFQIRKELVDSLDFCILGCYFRSTDTLQTWQDRHIPRIVEARKLYKKKPMFVTLAPHFFDLGKPWQHVPGDLLGGAMDVLAGRLVDGIVLWSFEGSNTLQTWDENWPWVSDVRSRIQLQLPSGGPGLTPRL